jgi:hypothetical protein
MRKDMGVKEENLTSHQPKYDLGGRVCYNI